MEIKIPMDGNLDGPKQDKTGGFDFSSLAVSRIPSLMELLREARKNIRPISEFVSTSNFKSAPSPQKLSGRVLRNLIHFQSNYLCIFLILMIYCLITSPIILLVLGGVLFACHKVRQAQSTVTIFGKRLNTYQQCLIVSIIAAPILYLAGAGSVMFWALGASFFIICLHAIFYNIDAIVTEETDGFLAETV